ncbi:MAG: hypothetical protein M9962_02540 [Oligoflexia bacterium]|nr:hypothetical protein [Oligoflexia bacterium]
MRTLLLALTLCLAPSFSQAADYTPYDGYYSATMGNNRRASLEMRAENQGLTATFIEGWQPWLTGATYRLSCFGYSCRIVTHVCTVTIDLLQNGSFNFYDCDGITRFYFTKRDSSGGAAWKVTQTVDPNGVLVVTAGVINKQKEASLFSQCRAPLADSSFSLKVNEVLWRAAAYSVSEGATLKILMDAHNTSHEFAELELQSGGLITSLDFLTEAQLAALQNGNTANVKLFAVGGSSETTPLGEFQFSLRGSKMALKNMQDRCMGRAVISGTSLLDLD